MKNTIILIVLSILCNIVDYGHGQTKKCGLDQFQCKNGRCISSILLCDGRADCRDQSDETSAECTKPEIVCPAYAFRCTYGACVDGDAPCNGIQDCIDNSDETLPRCKNTKYNASSRCSSNQFKCGNGQCIHRNNLCDGNAECADGSDETFIQCGTITCSQLVFRCKYGACIDGDLKCNGVINCADGSDEDPNLCRIEETESPVRPTTESPIVIPNTQQFGTACSPPSQPENGFWKLPSSQCNNRGQCNIAQSAALVPGTYLVYSCDRGYQIRGSSNVFCTIGGKWSAIPVCTEIRCKTLQSLSTYVEYKYNGKYIENVVPLLPGTVAELKCKSGYRPDFFLKKEVICNETGQWEPEPLRCVPECGIAPSRNLNPTSIYGTRANVTEFPWHASIYKAESPRGVKELICGATIISEVFLITAAHCVYNPNNKKIESASKFYIATGNVFRDYDYKYHDRLVVKKAEVKNIYSICTYNDLQGNYADDIAILEIKVPFQLSALLMPVCLDVDKKINLEEGMYGKVAGFGKTEEGTQSAILQTVTLPFVGNNKCQAEGVHYNAGNFIINDKFCAGYKNGTSVCDGDSGGGLVFQRGPQWYLQGIVSLSIGTQEVGGQRTCNNKTYSLFTKVFNHIDWIQEVLENRPYLCSRTGANV